MKGGAMAEEPRKMILQTSPVKFALKPFERACGLLAWKDFGGMLVIAPCRDVHTMGMRAPIDVAFIDGRGRVLEAHRMVGPFRRLRNRRAACVLERFSRCDTPWFRPGERIVLTATDDGMGEPGEGEGR